MKNKISKSSKANSQQNQIWVKTNLNEERLFLTKNILKTKGLTI